MQQYSRDLRSFEIRFEFESAITILFDLKVTSLFENFRIGRACPLLVVAKRLKPLTALSGTVYRLAGSMSDHTPVLFNVFEDWNEESVVPHIGVDSIRDSIRIRIVMPDSIRIRFERKRPIRRSLQYSYTAI